MCNRIVEEHLHCIDTVIWQNWSLIQAARLERDDVYQQRAVRLIRCVDTYDPAKGSLKKRIYAQLKYELLNCKEVRRLTGLTGALKEFRRGNNFGGQFAALFQMPDGGLRDIACRYEIQQEPGGTSCEVVLEHCVFCGCAVKTKVFQSERDALLYTALLQTTGYQPRCNLSCPPCYEKYEKSLGLSKD